MIKKKLTNFQGSISTMCNEYYHTIDTIFGKLIELYGINVELIKMKEDLINGYEKSKGDTSCDIINKLKVRHFKIDENGYIQSI